MDSPAIAFLGTGLMGLPMARNLLSAGFSVTVWNRTASKAEPLKEHGAVITKAPSQAVIGADIVISMLSDGAATEALLFDQGVVDQLEGGACFIDMSSAKPAEVRDHALRLSKLGVKHIDAPVSGGTKGAQAGTLAIMAGGDSEIIETVKPVLQTMGNPVHVGPSGSGQLSKLANQAIVAVTIGVVAEAMLLTQQGGADPAAIRRALKGGFADSTILQQHGERMTTGNFVPGGLSRLQLKDLNNVLEEAGHNDLKLPLAEAMQQRFTRLVEQLDGSELDHSAIWLELLAHNQLPSKEE